MFGYNGINIIYHVQIYHVTLTVHHICIVISFLTVILKLLLLPVLFGVQTLFFVCFSFLLIYFYYIFFIYLYGTIMFSR